MLGYDLQISRVTERVMAGNCEQGNVCLVVQEIKNCSPSCTNNHTVTQMVEAVRYNSNSNTYWGLKAAGA